MQNKYSVLIDYSPAYELVMSFYCYILQKELKGVSLGTEWYEETRSRLPTAFAAKLDDQRWEVLHRTVLLISQCPQKETVADFLHWLELLPPGELYERLSPWVSSIPLNLGEIRDQSVYLLSEWNQHYFQYVDPHILQMLQEDAVRRAEQSKALSPVDLVEQATNGLVIEPTDQLQQVVLVPQYHCHPTTILDFFRGMATCIYPVSLSDHSPTSTLLPLAQCLADEKRLRILAYIAKRPRTLIEVHQEIGLAKSTVHHHITALRRAGMIRSHFIDSTTPAYYSIRDSFIELFHKELRSLLDKEEFHHE